MRVSVPLAIEVKTIVAELPAVAPVSLMTIVSLRPQAVIHRMEVELSERSAQEGPSSH